MSYQVSEAITEIRGEFEGGKAMSLDFFAQLKRGARNTLNNINPETLKRRVPIFGGIANNMVVYYCPEDVRVPSAIYKQPHDRRPVATYTDPAHFFSQNKKDLFTLEYINGVRFLLVRQSIPYTVLTIDEMDEIGTKVSDETLTVNQFNFISGSGALQRQFSPNSATPGANTVSDTFDNELDISDFLNGLVIIPAVFENAENIAVVKFRFKNDDDNYITLSSVTDSIGDNFINGLNMVRLTLANRVATGTPVFTSIASWELVIETTAGEEETVIIDKITLQKSAHYYFEYYSNRMFIDGTTGAWKESPAKGDLVNLAQEARDILHYETVLLIAQGNTKIRQSRSGFDNFTGQLSRVYNSYWEKFPSTEEPVSYNTLHDDRMQYLPDSIGMNLKAGVELEAVYTGTNFADNETPSGTIDGVNATFTLSETPNPGSSLMLWLNGTYLQQGVDYTLSTNIITFTTPPDILFAGTPFVAFYRYS